MKEEKIYSPLKGKMIPVADIADPIFSSEKLGKGIAVIPEIGEVLAPAEGKIKTVFPSKHAVAMLTRGGAEIMIHVGIDTVELDGKPFDVFVKAGQHVKKGDRLIAFQLDEIISEGYDQTTTIIIMNSKKYAAIETVAIKELEFLDEIMTLR